MAAITSNAVTGNWNATGSWAGGVIPVSGDTVTLADGAVITVPAGYTAVCGNSPTDDTGTPAIQCASTTGTGVLVVNGTLQYKAPVRQANATWTVGAGGTLTYDASGAATPASALYTWQVSQANASANAKLVFNGSSGSHCTVNSVGNVQSGGIGNTGTNFTGGGRIEATYTDFGYAGPATSAGFCFPFRVSATGDQFILDHCTLDHCAQTISRSAIANVAVVQITNTKVTNCAASGGPFQLDATAAKTTGTRRFENNVWSGFALILGSSGVATGFSIKNNVGRKASFAATSNVFQLSGGASAAAFDQNLFAIATNSTSADGVRVPAGTSSNNYVFRHGDTSLSNAHPCYVQPSTLNYTFSGWVWEYTSNDDNSDFLEISNDATAAATLTVTNNVYLPNAAGLAVGSFINNISGASQTNLKITFDHNTCAVSSSSPTNVYGVGGEIAGTTFPAGAIPSIRSNLCWRPASGTGLIAQSNSSATVNSGAVTAADYNATWNVTGSIYGTPSGQFAVTPGAHDVAANPQFVDAARNLFTFDTGYLGHAVGTAWATSTAYAVGDVVSSATVGFYQGATLNWRCVTAHTSGSTTKPGSGSAYATNWEPASIKYIEDSLLAGTTYSGGTNSIVGELVAWTKAGFAPQNAALHSTAHDGTDIGAVAYVSATTYFRRVGARSRAGSRTVAA